MSTLVQKIQQWLCKRCGHNWPIRDPESPPKKCPRCHDDRWQHPYTAGATDGRRKGKRKFDSTARRKRRVDTRRQHL